MLILGAVATSLVLGQPLPASSSIPKATIARHAESRIHVTMDMSNPELTLKLLSGNYTTQDVARFKTLPGTLALVSKAKATWKLTVTPDDLVKLMQRAKAGETKDLLAYDMVLAKRGEIDRLITQLNARQATLEDHLSKELSPYLPERTNLTINFVPILGGLSAGFTLGDPHTMYSGIHYFEGDYLGLQNMLLHEAFHNVQALVDPNLDLEKCLTSEERRANDILQAVLQEGSAEYVADIWKYGDEAPYLRKSQQHLDVNKSDWRYLNIEKLIDYAVVSAMDARNAPNADVLDTILFDYNWHNPGYYFGYKSTKLLVQKHGQARLKSYLRGGGAQFFHDLLAMQAADRAANGFSPRFAKIVDQLVKKVSNCPAKPLSG